jgi:hypothetical protein
VADSVAAVAQRHVGDIEFLAHGLRLKLLHPRRKVFF